MSSLPFWQNLCCDTWNKAIAFTRRWLLIVLICRRVTAYNFSHRIDHLSFGEAIPGIISPLDGTEKVSADCTSVLSNIFIWICAVSLTIVWEKLLLHWANRYLWLLSPANHMFQYFITIVPTKLNTYQVSAETHQYSVTEQVGWNLACIFVCVVCCASVWWICLYSSCCSAGPSDKPRCRQPRSLRDLHEIRYQLTDGQSHRAAHASLAVSHQTLWHHWRHFLHHR